MSKSTITFWLLFIVSIALSALLISVFFKVLKLIIYIILVMALTPMIYLLLRSFFKPKKDDDDKLGKRS